MVLSLSCTPLGMNASKFFLGVCCFTSIWNLQIWKWRGESRKKCEKILSSLKTEAKGKGGTATTTTHKMWAVWSDWRQDLLFWFLEKNKETGLRKAGNLGCLNLGNIGYLFFPRKSTTLFKPENKEHMFFFWSKFGCGGEAYKLYNKNIQKHQFLKH